MPSRSRATLRGNANGNGVRKTSRTSRFFSSSSRAAATYKRRRTRKGGGNESDDRGKDEEKDEGEPEERDVEEASTTTPATTNIKHAEENTCPLTTIQEPPTSSSSSSSPRKLRLSPYFPKPLPLIDSSCLPFPSISAPSFGLIQEQLRHDPFRLLIATILLNRTRGPVAIPVLFQLFKKFPTISSLAAPNARPADIVHVIRNLGFQNQRARKIVALATVWLRNPPRKGRRYRKLHYPCKGDGTDVRADEVVADEAEDDRVAWEIAHLPGVGAYAIDSWRIFCRDDLVRVAAEDQVDLAEPEWKRVRPRDKELRAYLAWRWLKEGWVWDPETGQRTPADKAMMERAEKGGVVYEAPGGNWVLDVLHEDKHTLSVRRAGFSLEYS